MTIALQGCSGFKYRQVSENALRSLETGGCYGNHFHKNQSKP